MGWCWWWGCSYIHAHAETISHTDYTLLLHPHTQTATKDATHGILGVDKVVVKSVCPVGPQARDDPCRALAIAVCDEIIGVVVCDSGVIFKVHVTYHVIIVLLKQRDLCGWACVLTTSTIIMALHI